MSINNSSARPSIINVIETVRVCAFAPPSSSLDRRSVVVFPRSVNKFGLSLASLSLLVELAATHEKMTSWIGADEAAFLVEEL
jgi:hypothetical protein